MPTQLIVAAGLLLLIGVQIILLICILARGNTGTQKQVLEKFTAYEQRLDKNETVLKDEFNRNRTELKSEFAQNRTETHGAAKSARDESNASFTRFTMSLNAQLKAMSDIVTLSGKQSRAELAVSLDKIRDTVEKKLSELQSDNSTKLEQMRVTVDEKLHATLETRLSQSFKLVSERLELVQKGLGEMQSLAVGVGDLKKVLSNVKTKGVLGEYQLAGILEQTLTPDQYEQNVKTKAGPGNERVEFAVKIPGKQDSSKILWLPIDAKFPTEDYERLISAYDSGAVEEIELHKKELERKIKIFARDIKTKYVDPPSTTDFALMFLPFEGLYAEVLRIPGLFDTVQREYRITITGPTTISAFLSSLQMGFRTLAVEKRTSEIWELLGAVRTEFGKFGDVLEKTKEKLDSASKEIENAGTRSRAIERRLRDVQSLPATDAQKLLGDP
jgi:DNA recombination protein RmuC